MAEPTYADLMDTIIAVHCRADDKACQFYWADVYDGRAWRAFPEFWKTPRTRSPRGTVAEIVRAWSHDELRALYDQLLWDRG